jgi:tetratricopeptide (TPR) repeat protein
MTYKSSDLFQNKDSEQFYKQAQSYQYKGNLDSALICFDKADKSAPNTAVILHERGLLKSSMKKYDDAFIDLNKSIEFTTDQRQKEIRISNRALTYMEMGNMTEACKDWKNSGKWGKSYIEKYCK